MKNLLNNKWRIFHGPPNNVLGPSKGGGSNANLGDHENQIN